MTLSEYLRRYGIKQSAFAVRIGTSQAAVCRYCNGRRPAFPQLEAIIAATGGAVTANDFMPPEQIAASVGVGFGQQAAVV